MNSKLKIFTCYLILFIFSSVCETIDEDWIDPFDMFNDVSTAKLHISKSEDPEMYRPPALQSDDKENSFCEDKVRILSNRVKELEVEMESFSAKEVPYFRNWIQKLVRLSGKNTEHVEFLLKLDFLEVEVLRNFSRGELSVQDAHEVLTSSVELYSDSDSHVFESDLLSSLAANKELMLIAIVACLSCYYLANSVSISQVFRRMILVSFVVSIPWNWTHLYKMEVAKRYSDMLRHLPADCKPRDQQSLWEAFVGSMKIDSVDDCTKYHQKAMIDPFWEIPPTKAVAVTITKFFVEPLEHVGGALNLFIQKTLVGLPFYLWITALFFAVLFLVLIMVMLAGYKLHLFHLFGIEPGSQAGQAKELQSQVEHLRLENTVIRNERDKLKYRLRLRSTQSAPAIDARESVENLRALDTIDSSKCIEVGAGDAPHPLTDVTLLSEDINSVEEGLPVASVDCKQLETIKGLECEHAVFADDSNEESGSEECDCSSCNEYEVVSTVQSSTAPSE